MFSPDSQELFPDLFNRNGERNAFNTDQCYYNCGGYALGTFSWYLPSHTPRTWGLCKSWTPEHIVEVTKAAVEIMLHDFADLRLIKDLRQVQRDEYAIVFRVSSDGDFHYCRQDGKKKWTHKPGNTAIRRISERYIFGCEAWSGRYNGPLVMFAKKRG